MARLVIAPRAFRDIDRLGDFLLENWPEAAAQTGELILEALSLLKNHPLMGRPAEHGLRELMISRGRSGYVALYAYDPIFLSWTGWSVRFLGCSAYPTAYRPGHKRRDDE